MIMTLQDLTTQRQTESVRADFVANVSHELRTPLSTLVGFIETLQGPARDDREAAERFLGIMRDQAGRMSRLVEDLLSLSKIEMNAAVLPSGAVAVGDLLHTVAESLSLQAERDDQKIVIDSTENLRVRGDADELTQVFWNLIENALKYGRESGKVSINVQPADGDQSIRIAVSDDGEGIEEKHLDRLTERFYRADKGRSRAMGGTGLGLGDRQAHRRAASRSTARDRVNHWSAKARRSASFCPLMRTIPHHHELCPSFTQRRNIIVTFTSHSLWNSILVLSTVRGRSVRNRHEVR